MEYTAGTFEVQEFNMTSFDSLIYCLGAICNLCTELDQKTEESLETRIDEDWPVKDTSASSALDQFSNHVL